MYPAGGAATFRRSKTGKDVVLGGGKLMLPAGVGLHMPITAVHHMQGIWEEPQVFNPERFFEVSAAHSPFAEAPCTTDRSHLIWQVFAQRQGYRWALRNL